MPSSRLSIDNRMAEIQPVVSDGNNVEKNAIKKNSQLKQVDINDVKKMEQDIPCTLQILPYCRARSARDDNKSM